MWFPIVYNCIFSNIIERIKVISASIADLQCNFGQERKLCVGKLAWVLHTDYGRASHGHGPHLCFGFFPFHSEWPLHRGRFFFSTLWFGAQFYTNIYPVIIFSRLQAEHLRFCDRQAVAFLTSFPGTGPSRCGAVFFPSWTFKLSWTHIFHE